MRQIVIRKDPVPALNSRDSLMGCGSSIHISCPETADALLKDAVNETVPLAALLEEFRRFTKQNKSEPYASWRRVRICCLYGLKKCDLE